MFGSLGVPELVIIMVIALLVFGPRKLPELGKALGQTITAFKKGSAGLLDQVNREIGDEQRTVGARSGANELADGADHHGGPDRLGEVQVKAG